MFKLCYVKLFKASGLLAVTASRVGQEFIFVQSPQVVTPFFNAHWRMPQRLSQKTVFLPFIRQPSQLICSGRMGALFNSDHNLAVFSRKTWSLFFVAMYASHFSQSSPQTAINRFIPARLVILKVQRLPPLRIVFSIRTSNWLSGSSCDKIYKMLCLEHSHCSGLLLSPHFTLGHEHSE